MVGIGEAAPTGPGTARELATSQDPNSPPATARMSTMAMAMIQPSGPSLDGRRAPPDPDVSMGSPLTGGWNWSDTHRRVAAATAPRGRGPNGGMTRYLGTPPHRDCLLHPAATHRPSPHRTRHGVATPGIPLAGLCCLDAYSKGVTPRQDLLAMARRESDRESVSTSQARLRRAPA